MRDVDRRLIRSPRKRGLLAVLCVVCLLAGCTFGSAPETEPHDRSPAPSPADSGTTAHRDLTGLKVGPAPKPRPASEDPVAQAAALAMELRAAESPPMDAILTVFANSGIPVIEGVTVVAGPSEDFGGIPWWVVHQLRAADPATSVPLTDVVAAAVTRADGPVLPPEKAIVALTGDLNVAMTGNQPGAAFYAAFISADSIQHGGAGLPLDASSDPRTLTVGPVGAMLTQALIAREGASAAGAAAASYDTENNAPPPPELQEWSDPPGDIGKTTLDCVSQGDGATKLWWLKWTLSKAYGGIHLPGWHSDGLRGELFGAFKHAKAVFGALDWLSANLTVTVLLTTIAALDVSLTTDDNKTPERTTSTEKDGNPTHVNARVFYNFGNDDDVDALNCVLLMAALMVGFDYQDSLPKNGSVPGVEVTVKGGLGFTDDLVTKDTWVMFGPGTFSPKMTTNDNGEISIPVQGRRQRHAVNPDAPSMREFSLDLEAQPTAVTATSIANTFLESLTAWTGVSVPGFAKSAANIISTMHFNLGKVDEHVFPIRDWLSGLPTRIDVHLSMRWGQGSTTLDTTLLPSDCGPDSDTCFYESDIPPKGIVSMGYCSGPPPPVRVPPWPQGVDQSFFLQVVDDRWKVTGRIFGVVEGEGCGGVVDTPHVTGTAEPGQALLDMPFTGYDPGAVTLHFYYD